MNSTVSLLRYAAVDGKGWRRGPAILTPNGRLKSNTMLLNGVEVYCPNGRFQLRTYEKSRAIYKDIGNDPADVLDRYKAEKAKQSARAEAMAAGLELVEPEKAKKTLKLYAREFRAMHRSLPHRTDDSLRVNTQVTTSFLNLTKAVYPHQVRKEDVIAWHGWMRKELKYENRTCADRYLSLRGFLRYCGLNPSELIPVGTHKLLKAYTQRLVNTYTPEVIAELIKASNDENRKLLWDFFYKTGLRNSEVQMITRFDLHDLDTDNPMLHVVERDEYGNIKVGRERKLELHSTLVPRLQAWLKDHPTKVLVFGTETDKQDTKMLKALKITARNAGLNCGRCDGCKGKHNFCGEFTLHRFRRTYVTRMLRATKGDLRSVMARSGHVDLTSVMRYLEPAAHIREAVAQAF